MQLHPARSWAVIFAAAAMAAGAAAQSLTEKAPEPVPGLVLSDAEPPPAEDRDSAGALLLGASRAQALQQQNNPFGVSAEQRIGIPSAIGRGVARVMDRVRSWSDVREADATPAPRD